ncbi:AraC-like DNA-binding protein [Anaerotaenia torta]|uniref:AraC family transcriptional regulator n=1 Tax=Anaerotaenia torta TaxID=433293 RepID=UPI003D2156AC
MVGITNLEQYIQSGDYIEYENQQHYECEVCYVVKGKKGIYINDRLVTMEKGSLLFINSHVRHRTVPVSNEDYECFVFSFQPERLLPWKKMVPDHDFSLLFDRDYLHVKPEWIDQVFLVGMNKVLATSFMHNMESVFNHKFLEYIVYLNMKTGLDKEGQFHKHNGKMRSFKLLTDYIEKQNYCVTLEELSMKFYLNHYYICHLFKEISGMTLLEYINTHKVRKAQEMLKYTDRTITEIAGECGYDASSKFNRIFKKNVGVSPTEYRKKYKTS